MAASEPTPVSAFAPAGFFALRTPLLPFDELTSWSAGLSATHLTDSSAALDAAYSADRLLLRQRLRDIISRPEVREALCVASPDLDDRLHVWDREPDSEAGEKIERALVRYFSRMAGRPTPFGLFAGCSVGTTGGPTKLALARRSSYRRHTRLDMDYVVALAQALANDAALGRELAVYPNSSLYVTPGRVCYAEVRHNGEGWTHHKVALARSDYLDATLARARPGALPERLAAALIETDPEATSDEADEFVAGLIDHQVLVPELIPPLTGPEPILGIAARLSGRSTTAAADCLRQTQAALEALDAGGVGASPQRYRDMARQLQELPAKAEPGRLFQVDMVKPVVEATLGGDVVAEILRGVTILQRLARRPPSDPIVRFRERFIARYEGREVPLVEALDHEVGIGFDVADRAEIETSSLLEGLTFPQANDETAAWGKRETALLGKLSRAVASGSHEIVLEAADVEELSLPDPLPLPDAFAAMGAVAAASPRALERGEFQVLLGGASGPSGARLLGRFCHADPALEELVRRHLRAEEALCPDAILAEIVHLPESRLGNILARPVLRPYEIPYLGRPGVGADHQILVTDLRVSVIGNEIVLRSARLGRRVIPRLTSAHNFQASQGTYKFLCALQGQGTATALAWDWGPLRQAPVLPRVVCGRLVLSRATWRLNRDELRAPGKEQGAARFRALQRLRTERRLPRWVSLTDGDNELPVDLDNVLGVETLIELVKTRDEAILSEIFPGPEELVASGPEGRFVHEFVVPFVRTADAKGDNSMKRSTAEAGKATRAVCRSSPPGSKWLFAKFYCGQTMADRVLREVVQPVVENLERSAAADRWFFIRYGDPDWHIRVRFHGDPRRLQAEVLAMLQDAAGPFLADGRVWRLQIDTYEREVERYGGEQGIALAEQLFHADSMAVLELLATADDARADLRWRIAVAGIDRLLDDLGLDLASRHAVMKETATAFAREFRSDGQLRKQVGDKYREERRGLELLLDGSEDSTALASSIASILRRRSERLLPIAGALRILEQEGRLERPLTDMAASYVHMHVNRLLPSAHRAQEMVLYDFLRRLYESQLARRGWRQSTADERAELLQSPAILGRAD
jgi:thiopeptide-type bacteriocin biosynthesis protein